jgi:peptidyl-prolyl cis-trans isomerase D
MQSPELQTDGRFDPAKWERFLASPAIRQEGVLLQLQQYYEDQIPREKLFAQILGEVYVSDARLWRMYQDANDSAAVSFVSFRLPASADSASLPNVTDAEINAYYTENAPNLSAPARAIVTALVISRVPTAADTAEGRERLAAVRARIAGGAKFEDVAKEVSEDSVSAADGGNLGKRGRGAWIKEFEDAVFALRPGQLSEPVKTPNGWHLIRVDERKGDSIAARHILLRHRQSDSAATATDRLADRVSQLAGGATDRARIDSAAAEVGIPLLDLEVIEGQRALGANGRPLPGLSQWATKSGARVGETSELLDGDDAYFVARLDSLVPGGQPPLARIRADIRRYLARRKGVEQLRDDAQAFASQAVSSSFEAAARARNLTVEATKPFTRIAFVPGLGQSNAAIGAAFSLSVGAVSAPIVTDEAVFVLRVDRRWAVARDAWEAQRAAQRAAIEQQMQQDRYRQYLAALRAEAKVVDTRKEVLAASRMEVPADQKQQ